MKLKICGLKELDNLLEVTDKIQPEFVGHILYKKSKRFVEDLKVLTTPINPTRVAVFVNESVENIDALLENTDINHLQLHGNETPSDCHLLKTKGYRVIKAFGIDDSFDFHTLVDYQYVCDYFLFDTKSLQYGGTGTTFNWKLLDKYNNSKPIFLSGGLNLDNIDENLKNYNIYCLDVNSKFEKEPGIKDIDLLLKLRERLNKIYF